MGTRSASVSVEPLESRTLLSATPVGLTPAQVRHAYGIDRIVFSHKGKAYHANGAGTTIAIVDAYDNPYATSDFKKFNREFGFSSYGKDHKFLLKKATPEGIPSADPDWGGEIDLDIEWAHIMAPKAKILLVEARSSSTGDLLGAVDFARHQPGVVAVSMSFGGSQYKYQAGEDSASATPAGHIGAAGKPGGVTFLASTGDLGAPTQSPSISPNVVAVGGTTLSVDAVGNWINETAWSDGGGGPSVFGAPKSAPDVALVADSDTGVAVYDTLPFGGQSGWLPGVSNHGVGGTSVACPLMAGIVALIAQGRTEQSKGSLDGATQFIPGQI